MSTLSYVPSWSMALEVQFRVNRTQFGDGYVQRVADGINTQLRKYNVTFQDRTDTEADGIETFLKGEGGVAAFDWTPTGAAAGKFVCGGFRRSMDAFNSNTITAMFEEVPA